MPKTASPVTLGAVDIGSNTIHLVVARTDGSSIEIVADEKDVVQLGEDVSFRGEISATKFDLTLKLLKQYQQISLGSQAAFVVFATEPLRAAHNSAHLITRARQELGITINVLSQPEEAVLSFRGATYNMSLPQHFIVADIGGGSTEIVQVNFHQITSVISLPIGAIKLRALCGATGDLTLTHLQTAQFKLGEIFGRTQWPENLTTTAYYGVMAGGNAKAITRLFNRGRRGEALSQREIQQAATIAASKSSSALAQEYNLVPSRAQTFGTGALIINAIMDKFELSEVLVSKYGIREGLLLTYAHYREAWRNSLNWQASSSEF